VTRHRAAPITLELAPDARAESDRTRECDKAADGVNYRRTREVVEWYGLDRGEPAVGSPCPVADDWVNEPADTEAVEQISDKPRSSDQGTRCDGAARVGECELKEPIGQERNAVLP
jgi:hypothetical protein